MKNLQSGFTIPIIIAIVALLAIGGGVYIYTNNNVEAPIDNLDSTNNNPAFTSPSNSQGEQVKPVEKTPVASSLLTQAQAEDLVYKKWSDCSTGDCDNVKVSFVADRENQYLITAIFTERDDSVSQTKREGLVLYSNGTLMWATYQPSPNEWRTCHPGRGSQTFSTEKCL